MAVEEVGRRLVLCALALGCALLAACNRRDPLPGYPRVVLWAWERPEDLRWLDLNEAAVAFLAKTITLGEEHITVKPRLQPLMLPPKIQLIGVARIEGPGAPQGDESHLASEISQIRELPGVTAIQIDFDAARSQRGFYRELVRQLRERLPQHYPLLITALVSWCGYDHWIDRLDVDAAVPMYFRMGPERGIRHVRLRCSLCRDSIGLSVDELAKIPLRRRIFLFNPKPWTAEQFRSVIAELERW